MKNFISSACRGALQSARRRRLKISDKSVFVGRRVQFSKPGSVKLGSGVRLMDTARLYGKVSIGENTSVRVGAFLNGSSGSITIGSNCSVHDYCVMNGAGQIIIGNDVRIAALTVVASSNHNFEDIKVPIRLQGFTGKPVVIEDDVWIGSNVSIMAGVRIGTGSVIGAGAVVSRSIPPRSVAVGNPARVISERT